MSVLDITACEKGVNENSFALWSSSESYMLFIGAFCVEQGSAWAPFCNYAVSCGALCVLTPLHHSLYLVYPELFQQLV